jgi:hypothetical protein
MKRADIEDAIMQLSKVLNLPLHNAVVTRLDVAHNIIVDSPVPVYLNHLGALRYATRIMEPDGLYYVRPNNRLCFYDKNKEQRKKHEPIPAEYKDLNVLRYEQRYMNRLGSQFGVGQVTCAMLYDEAFFNGLVSRWLDAYQSINKIHDVTLNFKDMTKKSDIYKMGVLALVERAGGENEMYVKIAEAQKVGSLTTKQAYDLRQVIRTACKVGGDLVVASGEIDELDKKLLEAISFLR